VAFQWHSYTYGTPAGAEELAQSASCTQAFRLGERVWGVQFHPEVTESQIEHWVVEGGDEIDGPAMLEETRLRIAEWTELGRTLCEGFCELAERAAAAA
jgi:GMP synthase-like glutamine amidotransferase